PSSATTTTAGWPSAYPFPEIVLANRVIGTSMWTGSGQIQASQERTVSYDADTTAGQSGGPVWQTTDIPAGCSDPCVVGSDSASFPPPTLNAGIRINQEVFDNFYLWRQFVTNIS